MREYRTQGDLFDSATDARRKSADGRSVSPELRGNWQLIRDDAEPILESSSFRRLYGVTFLGILSPRYSNLPGHPLSTRKVKKQTLQSDGSRADHSLAIAELILRFCDIFSLSTNARRYGFAWALIHDIATWPLSHTGEVAFSELTGISHKRLRYMMVVGDPSLPSEFQLSNHICEMEICPKKLLLLLSKKIDKISETDGEFSQIYSLIHSAITPDTLEGIYRSGSAIGVQVPDPRSIMDSFDTEEVDYINDTIVRKRSSKAVLEFWRRKKKIYETYINSSRAVSFESRWSRGIRENFDHISLVESLLLDEADVVDRVAENELPACDSTLRYKPPQEYFLDNSLKRKRLLQSDYPIENLTGMLKRRNSDTES